MCSQKNMTYIAPQSDIALFEVECSFMSGVEDPGSLSLSFDFEDNGVEDGGSLDYYEE